MQMMIRKPPKAAAKAIALARSKTHWIDPAELEHLKRKLALSQIKADRRTVRQIKADNIKKNQHPLDRRKAEAIVSRYFIENGDIWIRAVGWLHGQGYAASLYYYKKELPTQIEAQSRKEEADKGSGGIDVAAIIAAELSDDDPDLSV